MNIELLDLKVNDYLWYRSVGYNCPIVILKLMNNSVIQFKTLDDFKVHEVHLKLDELSKKINIVTNDEVMSYLLEKSNNIGKQIYKDEQILNEKKKLKNKIDEVLYDTMEKIVRIK